VTCCLFVDEDDYDDDDSDNYNYNNNNLDNIYRVVILIKSLRELNPIYVIDIERRQVAADPHSRLGL